MDWEIIETMVRRIADDAERAAACDVLDDSELAEWKHLIARLDLALQKMQVRLLEQQLIAPPGAVA